MVLRGVLPLSSALCQSSGHLPCLRLARLLSLSSVRSETVVSGLPCKCRQPGAEQLGRDGAHPANLAALRADQHGPPHLFSGCNLGIKSGFWRLLFPSALQKAKIMFQSKIHLYIFLATTFCCLSPQF